MAMIPPARCTSSICTSCFAGATFESTGTRRDNSSISSIVKSTSASFAAANKWRTVLVEPPIAISSVIAFLKAALVAIERGKILASFCS